MPVSGSDLGPDQHPKWRAALRAIFFSGLAAMASSTCAETAKTDGRQAVEGLWGLELFPDMSCANNPVEIDFSESDKRLSFSWPKSVEYDDGTVADSVTFTVLAADGRRLSLRRDRDGVKATIVVARNGRSFKYEEEGPNEGSRFDRCEDLAS